MKKEISQIFSVMLSALIFTSCAGSTGGNSEILKTEQTGNITASDYKYDFYEYESIGQLHSCSEGIIFDTFTEKINDRAFISVYNTASSEISEIPLDTEFFTEYENSYVNDICMNGDILAYCGAALKRDEYGKFTYFSFAGSYNIKTGESKMQLLDTDYVDIISYDAVNQQYVCISHNSVTVLDMNLNMLLTKDTDSILKGYIETNEIYNMSAVCADGAIYLCCSGVENNNVFKINDSLNTEWVMTEDDLSEFNGFIKTGTLKDGSLFVYSLSEDGNLWLINSIDTSSSQITERYEIEADSKELIANASADSDFVMLYDNYFELVDLGSNKPAETCLFEDCSYSSWRTYVYSEGNVYSISLPYISSVPTGVVMDETGNIVSQFEISENEGNIGYVYNDSSEIYSWNSDKSVVYLDSPEKIESFFIDIQDTTVLCGVTSGYLFNYDNYYELYSSDGSLDKQFEIDGDMIAFTDKSGSDELYYRNQNGKLIAYNISDDRVKEAEPVNNLIDGDINAYVYYDGGIHDFYVVTGGKLYTYDIGDESVTEIISDMGSITVEKLSGIIVINESGTMACATFDGICIIRPSDNEGKKYIKIAAVGLERELPYDIINEFNLKNDTYRIQVKKYQDYQEFDFDISSGKIADIIVTDGSYSSDKYEKMNMFADLEPVITNDQEINDNRYFMNLIDLLKSDDKLYRIFPQFSVSTLIYSGDAVPEYQGVSEFFDMMDKENIFIYNNCDDITDVFLDFSQGYIYENRKHGENLVFQNDTFRAIAEGVKEHTGAETEKTYIPAEFSGFISACKTIEEYEDELHIIGYPSENRNYSYIVPEMCYSISDKCEDKETAWEIVKKFFIASSSMENSGAFSVNRAVYENDRKNACEITKYKNIIDETDKIASSTGVMVKYDKSINDILAEEWLSYYAGDETLDNVLNGIQSRVNLYLQETK